MGEPVTFTIQCTMERRWVPVFLAMLRTMQALGSIGSSRRLVFFSDGDGDYRPKFLWSTPIEPAEFAVPGKIPEAPFFDAG